MRLVRLVSILLVFFQAAPCYSAEEWDNPSERYSWAYLAYLDRQCPIPADTIRHFVYFARDRESIHDHPLLENPRFAGAQIMYSWLQLEPSRDTYDFSLIEADYQYLKARGKRLFVQLQDATFFNDYQGIPGYLLADEFDGGAIPQRLDDGTAEGWTAKRWNKAV